MTVPRRAFTLIELLVVIAIISVLMTILLPGLSSARRQARATVGMANLRSLSQIMFVYTNDHKDEFLNPFRVDDSEESQPQASTEWSDAVASGHADTGGAGDRITWRFQSSNPQFNTEFFAYYWYSFLSEWRANGSGRVTDEMFSPADADLVDQARALRGRAETLNGLMLWPSSFLYSPTFWSDSERYGGSFTATTGTEPHGGTRGPMTRSLIRTHSNASVSSPGAKVMLFERADFFQPKRVEIRPAEAVTSDKSPAWNNPRSKTTVALADGNITQVKIADLTRLAAGGQNELLPAGTGGPGDGMPLIPPRGQENSFDLGGSPSTADGDYPLFFWATRNGVRGRDLAR